MGNNITDFLAWTVDAYKKKQKAFVDMSGMKTAAQLAAEQNPAAAPAKPGAGKPAAPAQPAVELAWKTFKDLGEAMAKPVGIVVTKDIYGKGPEEHGAAFKAAGDQQSAAEAWLTDNGFKKRGAYSWYAGNFRVDIGKDAKNTYLYITDDEGTAKAAAK